MRVTTLLCATVLLAGAARGGEWPGWRGPRGDGISDETKVPIKWGPTENIAWKTPIPGKGHSSPIVWGDRVFVTTCVEEDASTAQDAARRLLLCLDRRNGKVLWDRVVVNARLEGIHKLNSRASSTPATDGKYVYVTFLDGANVLVAAYDFDGKEVWKKSPGKFSSRHGFCSSPVLYRDMVIVNCDHDGDGYIVALDRSNGTQRWRIERPNKTRSYCVPIIVESAGKKQLVLSGTLCVASYDPDTGKLWWIIDGPTEQFVSSLVYLDGVFFLTAGYPTYHYVGIRPDGEGNVTKTHILWHHQPPKREGAYVPSPIAHDRWFFAVADDGWCNCFEAKTGRRVWLERLGRHHSASPVYADGHLYFTADDGETWVLKATGEKFEVVSRNPLGEECYSSPAVSRGQIFLRGVNHVYCIGK